MRKMVFAEPSGESRQPSRARKPLFASTWSPRHDRFFQVSSSIEGGIRHEREPNENLNRQRERVHIAEMSGCGGRVEEKTGDERGAPESSARVFVLGREEQVRMSRGAVPGCAERLYES